MNKKLLIGIVAGLLIVAVGTVLFLNSNKSAAPSASSANDKSSSTKLVAVKACDLLTLAEAKQILGSSATTGNNTKPTGTDSISVDTCSYTNNATNVSDIRIVTVMVRSALDNDGLDSNKEAFEPGGAANPSSAVAVSGYGDKAFWDPATYQMAVLNDNQWIGLVYAGTNPMTTSTLDGTKKVADLTLNN